MDSSHVDWSKLLAGVRLPRLSSFALPVLTCEHHRNALDASKIIDVHRIERDAHFKMLLQVKEEINEPERIKNTCCK